MTTLCTHTRAHTHTHTHALVCEQSRGRTERATAGRAIIQATRRRARDRTRGLLKTLTKRVQMARKKLSKASVPRSSSQHTGRQASTSTEAGRKKRKACPSGKLPGDSARKTSTPMVAYIKTTIRHMNMASHTGTIARVIELTMCRNWHGGEMDHACVCVSWVRPYRSVRRWGRSLHQPRNV